MQKNAIGLPERERTLVLNQIRRLEEIMTMIKHTSQALSKNVTVLSAILREQKLSSREPQSEAITQMFIMLDLSLRGAAMLRETHESLSDRLTEQKNSI